MDLFVQGGWHVLSHEIRLNRQLAVAPIHQNSQLNLLRTSKIVEGIHGRPNGPSAEKNVIYEDNCLSVNVKVYGGRLQFRGHALIEVVPVHTHVQAANSDRSEEHTSELQSRFGISYAVFCLKKKT